MQLCQLGINQIEEIKTLLMRIFSAPPWNDQWSDAQLQLYALELIGQSNSLSFGLSDDGILIGLCLGRIKHWHAGTEYWIDEFGIVPEKQRMGIGLEFLKKIEDCLRKRGILGIVLLTDKTVPAYHFYQKNGFHEKPEQVFFVREIS